MTKICLEEGCNTIPSYGKKGGSKKDTEYCVKHKLVFYPRKFRFHLPLSS